MKRPFILLLLSFFSLQSFAQVGVKPGTSVYEKIMKQVADFKLDTISTPNDKLTRKINALRSLNGVFNINEAIQYKIEEDKQKKDITPQEASMMADFFTVGDGKRLLDNAIVWIYRKHFNLKEVNQMVKFYKTDAGKKLTRLQPVIIFQSLTSAQLIGEALKKQNHGRSY